MKGKKCVCVCLGECACKKRERERERDEERERQRERGRKWSNRKEATVLFFCFRSEIFVRTVSIDQLSNQAAKTRQQKRKPSEFIFLEGHK